MPAIVEVHEPRLTLLALDSTAQVPPFARLLRITRKPRTLASPTFQEAEPHDGPEDGPTGRTYPRPHRRPLQVAAEVRFRCLRAYRVATRDLAALGGVPGSPSMRSGDWAEKGRPACR